MTKKYKKTLTPESSEQEIAHAVSALCAEVPVSGGAQALVKELALLMPQLFFREVLMRNGWYRLGGVVDDQGRRVADDVGQWVEAELAARRGGLKAMVKRHAASGYRATRLNGRTHYLVASNGARASDFIQIELEEMLEVVGHELFAAGVPGSVEELINPPNAVSGGGKDGGIGGRIGGRAHSSAVVGAPFYELRRVTNVAELLGRLAPEKAGSQSVRSFFEAWQSCSASLSAKFSNHWVLAVREHLDSDRQPVVQATPVAAISGALPRFECSFGAYGLALYDALQGFDREVGYPMAWFFHMLTTKAVPHAAANAVIDDVQAGFSYLPARDVKVIKDWLHRPFSF